MRVTIILALAALLAGCATEDDLYINLDGSSHADVPDEWVPDGTGPCEDYTDADGDTIPDQIEGEGDFDGDTIPNYLDLDSDGDTIQDAEEAGDDDLCTPPANTDWGYDSSGNPTGDDNPDFLDADSDNDGLSDERERELGTDPTEMDTDGDGVTDLGEVAFETDPTDPTSTMDPDDFFVILPYNGDHVHDNLTFGTNLQVADVYFLIDTTGSMSPAIENVATSLASVIVPGIRAAIPDVQMGVGHFNDVPDGISSMGTYVPHGGDGDEPYWNVQNITDDDTLVQDGLTYLYGPDFPWGGGGDTQESSSIALWCTATGNGFDECNSSVPAAVCPEIPDEPSPRRGYPCFRPESLPIIVHISDAWWHNNELGGYGYECTDTDFFDAQTELNAIGARYIGVVVDPTGGSYMVETSLAMATGTGSVDSAGEPLVQSANFGRVSESIVDLIATLAVSTPQDVNAVPQDEPDDPPGADYDATLFIKNITPLRGYPDAPEGFSSMDSIFFYGVIPGTSVTFDVDFHNNTVPPTASAQVFKAWILVLGNSVARLDRRKVVIIVPTDGMRDILI
jgi:hypothetical protein